MLPRLPLVLFVCFLQSAKSFIDVLELNGDPDFRSIKLQWKASGSEDGRLGFLISYCEDQAWGKHRCKKKMMNNAIDAEVGRWIDRGKDYRLYEATIDGLRIATSYKVEVKPTVNGEESLAPQRARALGGDLLIHTKEFQARAIKCLANSSLVEIETGPYFGGKISVEGSSNTKCATQGNMHSTQSTYLIDVDHFLCDSELLNTSVRTFLIVQENLPILTHSTRRFMVVCKYVPETFTVRAGVNLPNYNDYENDLVPVGNDVFEVDPSELFDSTGSLLNSRATKQAGRAMRLSSQEGQEESQKLAHLVLMVVLIMCAVVGVSCAVFHFVRQSRRKNRSGFMSPQVEPSAIEINESLEAVVRDFGERHMSAADPNISSQPSVALTGADFDCGSIKGLSEISVLSDSSKSSMMTFLGVHDLNDATLQTNPSNQHVTNIKVDGGLSFHSFVQNADDTFSSSEPDSLPSFIPADHSQSVSISNLENIDAVFDEALNIQPEHESASGNQNPSDPSHSLVKGNSSNTEGVKGNPVHSIIAVTKSNDKDLALYLEI